MTTRVFVIPAKAGIQCSRIVSWKLWIPASAGMTKGRSVLSAPSLPGEGSSAYVFFDTVIVGNFDEKSFAFIAIFTATCRAMALYKPATCPSGSATTVG